MAYIEVAFADAADVIESHIINLRQDRAHCRNLTDTQLQIIRTLIRPGAAENPFPERLQLRNWLMIELFLETCIRRGELLKLYTTDINQGSQHAYVSINDREHDPGDTRTEEPALKTHEGGSSCLNQPIPNRHYPPPLFRPTYSRARLWLRFELAPMISQSTSIPVCRCGRGGTAGSQ